MPPTAIDPAIRYHAKVDKKGPADCWEWIAARYQNQYGAFWDGARRTGAHRYGYTLLVGPIAPGLCVLHKCDNPPCQNPEHWFLGTVLENNEDRHAKGRSAGPKGTRSGWARLTEDQVTEIRSLYRSGATQRAIAETYSINRASVSGIVRGTRWAHLPGMETQDRRSPLREEQVLNIRSRYSNGESQYALAKAFGVSRPTIAGIVTRRYWKHV